MFNVGNYRPIACFNLHLRGKKYISSSMICSLVSEKGFAGFYNVSNIIWWLPKWSWGIVKKISNKFIFGLDWFQKFIIWWFHSLPSVGVFLLSFSCLLISTVSSTYLMLAKVWSPIINPRRTSNTLRINSLYTLNVRWGNISSYTPFYSCISSELIFNP